MTARWLYLSLYITYGVVFLSALYINASAADSCLRITAFDVGQGDGLTLQYGTKFSMLIDGGPSLETPFGILLENFRLPYLACHFTLGLLSHNHADHYKGFDRLVQLCSFEKILPGDSFKNFYATKVDDLSLIFIRSVVKSKDENANSVVVFGNYAGYKFILTGDIPKSFLCESATKYGFLAVDLLKASHHGSMTGLCDKISAKTVVVSVGATNTYGHPSPSLLTYYKNVGTLLYRTDLDGTVRIKVCRV